MDKKYQVFISSTYRDLIDERQEVLQALLELDCIPVGMELFPAADDDQWTLIKQLIDDCDYYILIVGGRYGSVSQTGISYTQMEYEYAVENGIPIISFLHRDPAIISYGKSEVDPVLKAKLEDFKTIVQQKMVKYWGTPSELGSQVSRSLVKLIKAKPRPGWTRADRQSSNEATMEILELKNRISHLENELSEYKTAPALDTTSLAQGTDILTLKYECQVLFEKTEQENNEDVDEENKELMLNFDPENWETFSSLIDTTWNDVFLSVAPYLLNDVSEIDFNTCASSFISKQIPRPLIINGKTVDKIRQLRIDSSDFHTIKIQFLALNLIAKVDRAKNEKGAPTYWSLTSHGNKTLIQCRAIKKINSTGDH